MRRVLLVAAMAVGFISCGDDRPENAGAGNTDNAAPNTTVGTGNGTMTYGGGDTAVKMPTDTSNNKLVTTARDSVANKAAADRQRTTTGSGSGPGTGTGTGNRQ